MLCDCAVLTIPAVVGYAAVVGRMDPIVTVPLALAACCWGGMYHTFGGGDAVWFSSGGRKRIKVQNEAV